MEEPKFAMRSPKITIISQEEYPACILLGNINVGCIFVRYSARYLPEITEAVTQILHSPDLLHFSQEEIIRYARVTNLTSLTFLIELFITYAASDTARFFILTS